MPGTARTPLRRLAQMQVSARALELFRELEKAARARRRAVDCTLTAHNLCTGDCTACRHWSDLHAELHVELRLKIWQWPALPCCPFPPNSPAAAAWQPGSEQQELWDLLDGARRAQPTKEHRHVEV
jgi:hypothetical protein